MVICPERVAVVEGVEAAVAVEAAVRNHSGLNLHGNIRRTLKRL